MIKFCRYLSVFLCLSFSAEAELFKAHEFFLDNGLHCVVIENHKAPIVKHMLWYKVGSVDENNGRGGSAHLLEHLMFRGTKKVSGEKFNEIMEQYGADSNAFTSHDMTVYHQFADISKLELLMALEADRMQNLDFDENDFAGEQKIVLQERKQVIENNPASPFTERLNKMLWPNSAYGHPVTGLSTEIMSLTYANVTDFYHKYYAPNNAILIVSGDINFELAKQLIEKYYGNIERKAVVRTALNVDDNYFAETLDMALPNITASQMVQKWLLSPHNKLQEKIFDYVVLAQYLGGGETSALYKQLVLEQNNAVSISAAYKFATSGNTVFSVSLVPAVHTKQYTKQLWKDLYAAMEKSMKNLTAAKLEQIKRKILADLVYVNDNPTDAAYQVGIMLVNGFSLDDVQNYAEKIKNVTLKGVMEAYKSVKAAAVVRATLLPKTQKDKLAEMSDE